MKLLSLKSNQRTMTQESVFYFVRYRFFSCSLSEKGFKLKHTITQLPYCMEKRPKSTCLKLANDQSTKKETVLGFGNFNSNPVFYVLPFFWKTNDTGGLSAFGFNMAALDYGCHCSAIITGQYHGHGQAVDPLDAVCKEYLGCIRCVKKQTQCEKIDVSFSHATEKRTS